MKIRFVFVDYCYLKGEIIFLASSMHCLVYVPVYTACSTFVFDSRGLIRTLGCSL